MDFLAFFNDPAGITVLTAFGLVGLRLVLGVTAALKDGTFVMSQVGSFIRSQVLGRVFPFAVTAFFAWSTGHAALMATAAAIGGAFVLETVGAIQESLSDSAKVNTAEKEVKAAALGNPVPNE